MGDFVLGLAKWVVEGALTKAQSAIEEEKKLQESVQSDLVFITGEFQMMQSFLNATKEEHVRNNVVRTWVRQVRDLAYDVEDCIEFVVHLDKKPSWWFRMLPSCMAPALPLDEAVAEMQQLKARVVDVSNRNARYNLITDSGSKPAAVGQQQPMATAGPTAFDIVQEARDTARKHRGLVDLTELIANMDDPGLQVISLWGTGGDLGTTSTIKKAYDDRNVRQAFGCRGWAKLTRPFNPQEFLWNLLIQLSASSGGREQGPTAGVDALTRMEAAAQDELVKEFVKQVEEKRYLVVLEDLSTVVEWETIRMYLPDKKNGSRIVVSSQQLEIASLCTPQPCVLSELMQLSADHSLCVFYSKKGRRDGGTTKETIDQVVAGSVSRGIFLGPIKNFTFEKMKLALDWMDRAHVVGREKESVSLYHLLRSTDRHAIDVISVWGIAGVGKSTLVKDVYYRAMCYDRFARCGWVDVSRSQPFDLREFSRSLLSDLYSESLEAKKNEGFSVLISDLLLLKSLEALVQQIESLEALVQQIESLEALVQQIESLEALVQQLRFLDFHVQQTEESLEALVKQKEESLEAAMLGFKDPIEECCKLLRQERCLVVIDGLRSTEEWDLIKAAFVTPGAAEKGTRIMVIATEESVATHCSVQDKCVYNVKGLGAAAAHDLFYKEVFKNIDTPDLTTDMKEQAKLLVDKCGGLPEVIVAIGRFLAIERKESEPVAKQWLEESAAKQWLEESAAKQWLEQWRELNDSFMHELETNPRLDSLRGLYTWMHTYFRTCPDYIKPCIFYLSIFPAGKNTSIRRRRLVGRWIAEGYSKDMDGHTAEEKGETFFSELVGLSIIQQPPETASATYTHNKRMVSCQVNGFFREYIRSRSMEDNLVFALEGSCSVGATRCRHLAIRGGWDRDRDPKLYGSIDFSRLRSLTVFGEWRPFFVSQGMRLLRVLDLEDTSDLKDDDLEQIGRLVPRLKFLSVRGCREIHRLPDSLGGLPQLETLDARNTSVSMLPTVIVKLQKLQYLRAGAVPLDMGHMAASPPPPSPEDPSTTPSRRISTCCCRRHPRPAGAGPPVGFGEMTTLHTLGVVDVSVAAGQGEAVLKELKKLTRLRKLGVSGINAANSKELWSAISGHRYLESLSVRLEDAGRQQGLYGCSHGTVFSPPEMLQSLKLHGLVDTLPPWIVQLHNLSKLNLHMTILAEDIYNLGDLPNLRILRLCPKLVLDGNLHFRRRPEHDGPRSFHTVFKCLGVLEIACNYRLQEVIFGDEVMPFLELLKVRGCSGSSLRFSGLHNLYSIKRIFLKDYEEAVKKNLESEIGNLLFKPDLELE